MKTKIYAVLFTLVACALVTQPVLAEPTASRAPKAATRKTPTLPAVKKPARAPEPVAKKKKKVTLPKTIQAVKKPKLIVPSKVTGISYAPKNPMAGQKIRVWVKGTPKEGDCKIFLKKNTVDMTPAYKYGNSKRFPYSALSSNLWPQYDKPGTYILKAIGKNTINSKCSGSAQVVVQVRPKVGLVPGKLKPKSKTATKDLSAAGIKPQTPSMPMSDPSEPTLQKSPSPVMHKTVNSKKIGEMIDSMPFTANVSATPRKHGIEFHMQGTKETRWQVRLYTQGLTTSQYCQTVPGVTYDQEDFLAVQQSLGKYTEWTTVVPIDPNRSFKYEVCAIQYKDDWRFEGQSHSIGKKVEVTVGNVTITDDGDSGTKGAGDLWFSVKLSDQMTGGNPAVTKHNQHFHEIDTGHSVNLNSKFTFMNPKGDHLDLRMFVGDCDMYSNSDCGVNEGNYDDWALLTSDLNTIPAADAEETNVYNLSGVHHGVGFDAQVTVTIK